MKRIYKVIMSHTEVWATAKEQIPQLNDFKIHYVIHALEWWCCKSISTFSWKIKWKYNWSICNVLDVIHYIGVVLHQSYYCEFAPTLMLSQMVWLKDECSLLLCAFVSVFQKRRLIPHHQKWFKLYFLKYKHSI